MSVKRDSGHTYIKDETEKDNPYLAGLLGDI